MKSASKIRPHVYLCKLNVNKISAALHITLTHFRISRQWIHIKGYRILFLLIAIRIIKLP